MIVYLLYYLSKKDDVYTITFPKKEAVESTASNTIKYNGNPIIKKEFKNDTYYLDIDECVEGSFENIKKDIFEQYKVLGYDNIAVDKDTSFKLKSVDNPRGYIQVSFKNQIVSIEAYNVKVAPLFYKEDNINTTETTSTSNTDKLIELSKLVENGLLTKEEFEKMKEEIVK